jgi:hypothetical protein
MVSLADYAGREQAYVKHVFLERYLEVLALKTASTYDHIVYVDGYAGPWQSANERFEDTSFVIALNALRRAKETWQNSRRDVRMTALLVERDPKAHAKLATLQDRYPDITIKTYQADFIWSRRPRGITMTDRTTKLLLAMIALALWAMLELHHLGRRPPTLRRPRSFCKTSTAISVRWCWECVPTAGFAN